MNTISLTFRTKTGELVETLTATFGPKEIELLRRFDTAVSRVRVTALLRRGMPSISNMRLASETGMEMEITCPPYEDGELHELLHVLRPLILQNEAISFHNIASLLGKRFSSERFRARLKAFRELFENGEFRAYMQMEIDGQPLFDDSFIKLWLNSEQYHMDEEKAAVWKELETALSVPNTRAIVITQLQGKVKALFWLQFVAGLVLQKVEVADK